MAAEAAGGGVPVVRLVADEKSAVKHLYTPIALHIAASRQAISKGCGYGCAAIIISACLTMSTL